METINNRNRNGRPAKGAVEKKGHKVSLKMGIVDYYLLKAKARLAGLTLSEYVRQAIEKSEVKQRLSSEQLGYIRQLSGMANNINQIARKVNAAGYTEFYRECRDMIDWLDKIVKQMTE